MRPLFIVFEGIDGSGKTTQAEALKAYFIRQGESAILSPEPSDGLIGKFIRQSLQQAIIPIEDQKRREEQMAYLFAADRHYHLYNDLDGVLKLIEKDHCHVITPRYYFSSLAYNCHTPEEYTFVSRLNQAFPNPDLVIYLDLPVDIALARISDRQQKECYEKADKLTEVSQNYQRIFQDYSGRLLAINGQQSPEKIQTEIINFITHYLA